MSEYGTFTLLRGTDDYCVIPLKNCELIDSVPSGCLLFNFSVPTESFFQCTLLGDVSSMIGILLRAGTMESQWIRPQKTPLENCIQLLISVLPWLITS